MEGSEIFMIKGNCYIVFLFWDIYCNVYQLMILFFFDWQLDMVCIMVDMYKEYGWLFKWEFYGCEIFIMEGDLSIFVIVDIWMKGLCDFDV